MDLEDLPEIDIVVISHGHYDHLDFPTLKKIKRKSPIFRSYWFEIAFYKKRL